MSLETALTIYGYPILYLGTILEGETFLILSALLCQTGHLEVGWVICFAFLGAMSGDLFCFQMGRWGGHRFLGSGNRWQHRVQKANRLLERHQSWIVLGYRFLYGLRAVIPFLIGATGYSFRRFFLLSCIGGIVWSITITLAGIAFGKIVLAVLSDIQQYQFWVLGFIGMIGILLWVIHSSD